MRRLAIALGVFLAVAGFGLTRYAVEQRQVLGPEAWQQGAEIPLKDIMDNRELFPLGDEHVTYVPDRTTPLRAFYGLGWALAALGAGLSASAAWKPARPESQ